jgi:hypothetical protein
VNKVKVLLGLLLVLAASLAAAGYASATSSAGFHEVNGDVYDDWEICRTRAHGEDGFYQMGETTFRPVIAFESLGGCCDAAYGLGEQFAAQYPDPLLRAEKIFCFVRDRVNYTSDVELFEYEEFAQNADELATVINQNGVGYGDCEDTAVLLAVMYKGAGYRSAIVVGSGHTAALVYLPDYKKASASLELEEESGWVWAEATGKNNRLGWVPKEFINVRAAAYEVGEEAVVPAEPSPAPSVVVAQAGGGASFQPFSFFSILAFLWLISLFRRRR